MDGYDKKKSSIFLAGHNGLVGSAILRKLKALNFKKVITIPRNKLDLTDRNAVKKFFKKKKNRLFNNGCRKSWGNIS